MTLSEYTRLKQQIKISVESSERHTNLLASLKDIFKDDINSPRRLESITSIGQLLDILEIRDALSEDKVDPLKRIAERLANGKDILTKIAQYEAAHVPREYGNYYDVENALNPSVREFNNITISNPHNAISPTKRQKIIQIIVEEIGTSWRDLARNMKIRECVINDIDKNYKSLARKALRLMEIYVHQKADPDKWFFDLCDALDNTRRKDLRKSLQKILVMNV